ncbi:hypothetical protein R3X25_09465 [Lutibacter sp. TH_r2]|uniref:hypothetical protein n=1 Tax=Lutibacter sp. TH_r2 TaxID=3082083 RepID=UPI0029550F24|nr:hypothetical protein [Lutibacter sp. TH_r2]MDV7187507.1 hypothetical protein [Lutibacter sp. TH_r2]
MNRTNKKIRIDLTIFEKNGQKEFVQIVQKNKLRANKAMNDFFRGIKNEAVDTKETSRIILKFVATQNISKIEEKHIKTQVYDMFKILGIGVPFVFIPGATLIIPFLLKVAEKKGIDLIPSNFKAEEIDKITIKSKNNL